MGKAQSTKVLPYVRETHMREGGLVKDVVLGMNDGLVSILSLVSGVAGSGVGNQIVLIAGVAGAIAGSLSMAFGTYISHKSQLEFYDEEFKREEWEIKNLPKNEEAEIREIYEARGFRGKELGLVVRRIISDKKVWLEVMMLEELGLIRERFQHPLKVAAANGIAFIAASAFPILPYFILSGKNAVLASVAATMLALFAAGAIKAKFTKKSWWRSGLEMVLIGALATAATYLIGSLFNVQLS